MHFFFFFRYVQFNRLFLFQILLALINSHKIPFSNVTKWFSYCIISFNNKSKYFHRIKCKFQEVAWLWTPFWLWFILSFSETCYLCYQKCLILDIATYDILHISCRLYLKLITQERTSFCLLPWITTAKWKPEWSLVLSTGVIWQWNIIIIWQLWWPSKNVFFFLRETVLIHIKYSKA